MLPHMGIKRSSLSILSIGNAPRMEAICWQTPLAKRASSRQGRIQCPMEQTRPQYEVIDKEAGLDLVNGGL